MTATLEGGEWSAARPGRTLPPGKTRYPFYSRLGGPQGRSGRAENLVPTGIRSRTVQPVVSRYTDWAIVVKIYRVYYSEAVENWYGILWTYFAACKVRRIFLLSSVSVLWRKQNCQQHFLPVTYSNSKNSERAYLLILKAFEFYYGHIQFECWPGKLNSEWIYPGISWTIQAKYQDVALL